MVFSLLLFVAGLVLIVYFSEKLVEGAVQTSLGFGVSAFWISVLFIGFDPENLAVGAVASLEGSSGIALGTIIGAAMVAAALAFGITALLSPMEFKQVPFDLLPVPVLAVAFMGLLSIDGTISRLDGAVLLFIYSLSILYLHRMAGKGLDIKPGGEVAESLEKKGSPRKWRSAGLLLLSVAAVIAGSELLVAGSETIISEIGLSDTVFGMTLLALLISAEELARELPAALKGRPDIAVGNVIGSILAFFLFNTGVIALISPITVSTQTLEFYLPLSGITIIMVMVFLYQKSVTQWHGAILVLLYALFFAGGYFGWQSLFLF